MKTQLFALLIATFLMPAVRVNADEEEAHADIFIGRPEIGAQTLVGGATVAGAESDLNLTDRVFEGDLGTDGDTYFATEPGFFNAGDNNPEGVVNPDGALPLAPGDSISVSQAGDLLYWNGQGPVSFVATPAELTLDPEVFGSPNADGGIDDHPDFIVDDPNSGDLPTPGIYLATITATLTGLEASDELQVLLVTGEEFEDAVEVAEDFLNGVPEPTSFAICMFALLTCGVRRKTC